MEPERLGLEGPLEPLRKVETPLPIVNVRGPNIQTN